MNLPNYVASAALLLSAGSVTEPTSPPTEIPRVPDAGAARTEPLSPENT